MAETLYEILGVPTDADAEQIRVAYRQFAKKYHPDRTNNDPDSVVLFRRATAAYQVLINPVRRASYDRQFEPVRSIMQLFSEHPAGKRVLATMLPTAPAEQRRGADACVVLPRSRLTAARGRILPITIAGEVVQAVIPLEVPEDVRSVRVCLLPHLGSPGRNGGDNGDLVIVISEE